MDLLESRCPCCQQPTLQVGTAVFCAGLVLNWTADSALRDLRASSTGYAIPRGGLFEYVSCANFTGEAPAADANSRVVQTCLGMAALRLS